MNSPLSPLPLSLYTRFLGVVPQRNRQNKMVMCKQHCSSRIIVFSGRWTRKGGEKPSNFPLNKLFQALRIRDLRVMHGIGKTNPRFVNQRRNLGTCIGSGVQHAGSVFPRLFVDGTAATLPLIYWKIYIWKVVDQKTPLFPWAPGSGLWTFLYNFWTSEFCLFCCCLLYSYQQMSFWHLRERELELESNMISPQYSPQDYMQEGNCLWIFRNYIVAFYPGVLLCNSLMIYIFVSYCPTPDHMHSPLFYHNGYFYFGGNDILHFKYSHFSFFFFFFSLAEENNYRLSQEVQMHNEEGVLDDISLQKAQICI